MAGDFDFILSNPPYLVDPGERACRHGGGPLEAGLSRVILDTALHRLVPGGILLLYTGVAMVDNRDPFLEEIRTRLASQDVAWRYRERNSDIFGEELEAGVCPYRAHRCGRSYDHPAALRAHGRDYTGGHVINAHLCPGVRDATAAEPDLTLCPRRARKRLQLAGLGQGLIDTAFGMVVARKHGGAAQNESVLGARRLAAIDRLLARLEEHSELDSEYLEFGHYLVAVGLDYLSFRLPEIDWSGHRRLVAFHWRLMARPSFAATAFQ